MQVGTDAALRLRLVRTGSQPSPSALTFPLSTKFTMTTRLCEAFGMEVIKDITPEAIFGIVGNLPQDCFRWRIVVSPVAFCFAMTILPFRHAELDVVQKIALY